MQTSSKIKIPATVIAILGSLAMIAAFFLPFYSVTSDLKTKVLADSGYIGLDNFGLYGESALDISPYEASRGAIFSAGADVGAVLFSVVVFALLVFAALAFLNSSLGRGVSVIVFSILVAGAAVAVDILLHSSADKFYKMWKELPFDRALGYFLFLGGAGAALIGGVMLIIARAKSKSPAPQFDVPQPGVIPQASEAAALPYMSAAPEQQYMNPQPEAQPASESFYNNDQQ